MAKSGFVVLLSAFSLLCACNREPDLPVPAPESMRQTNSGSILGFADRHDTWSWLGIPYAAAPVAELRWRAPQPPQAWQGTLHALGFAPMCPQLPIPRVNDTGEPWLGDEDCLYLNVSAPKSWSAGDKPLPVMVWLHGGGNTVGSADLYSAVRNLAGREQVVTVSIAYRLGMLGWFNHPALREQAANELDASGNFGTLDTIAALQWVQDNIGAFGGDAGNVTVFGESAGGINTYALLLSPLANGLFHRAISQSGMLITNDLARAENPVDAPQPGHENSSTELLLRLIQADAMATDREQARQLLAQWDSSTIMTYLRAKPPQELLAQMQGGEFGIYAIPWLLRDGVVLPAEDPLQQLQHGDFNRVPVILGTNRDEMKTMMIRNPDYTSLRFGVLPRVIDQALYDRVTGYGSHMWKAIGADEPARAMHQAGHRDVFVYRFDWDEVPANWLLDFRSLLGASHSFEIPFVFNDMDNEMTYLPFDLIDADNITDAAPLGRAMSSYWAQFAYTGDPGRGRALDLPPWSRWLETGGYLVFDTQADGGIRMHSGSRERVDILRQLAGDGTALGGQAAVCLAYNNLFGPGAIFSFTTACPVSGDCAGAPQHFCPPAE